MLDQDEFAYAEKWARAELLLRQYAEDKRLNSELHSGSTLAVIRHDEGKGDFSAYHSGYGSLVRRNITVYREIYKAVEEVEKVTQVIEMVHWFDRPDLACRWKEFNDRQIEDIIKARGRSPSPFEVGSNAIQTYYSKSKARGHSFKCKDYKALLWGCAGRVLITLRKDLNVELSMIYDEGSKYPRSGIQDMSGTGEEILQLAGAFLKTGAKFVADKKVGLA